MKPKFKDGCDHNGPGTYFLGHVDEVGEKQGVDVRVFVDHMGFDKVCIRFGDEDHQYVSPGRLSEFLESQSSKDVYPNSYAMLSAYSESMEVKHD